METFIFQHVEFEGPGAILPILEAKGHRIHRVNLYAGDAVPDSSAVDFAVLMGGPMSALDEDKFPFLSAEKQFCRTITRKCILCADSKKSGKRNRLVSGDF